MTPPPRTTIYPNTVTWQGRRDDAFQALSVLLIMKIMYQIHDVIPRGDHRGRREFLPGIISATFPLSVRKKISLLASIAAPGILLFCQLVTGIVAQPDNGIFMYTGEALESAVPPSGQQYFERQLESHEFDHDTEGWDGTGPMRAYNRDGVLVIEADRGQPFLYHGFQIPEGELRVLFRMRTETASDGVFSWQTSISPRRSDDKKTRVQLISDGQWHDYEVNIPVRGMLTNLALQLTTDSGRWELDHLRFWLNERHPLVVSKVASVGDNLEFTIDNKGEQPVTFQHAGQRYTLDRDEGVRLIVMPEIHDCFSMTTLHLVPDDYPDVVYSAVHYHPEITCRWYLLPLGPYRFCITESGNMARIHYPDSERAFAIIAPFVHDGSRIPVFSTETQLPLLEQWELDDPETTAKALRLAREDDNTLRFVSEDIRLTVQTDGSEIRVEIDGQHFEGPVVRAMGNAESALFPGCEFPGPGDVSSSDVTVHSQYANRFSPNLSWLTMPLMAFHLKNPERFGEREIPVNTIITMTWDDAETQPQPTFDVPNRLDGVNDMRMSLRGRGNGKTEAVIQINEGVMSDAIRQHLQRRELPDIPPAPRLPEDQNALTLAAFQGPLAGSDGAAWGYCAEPDWPRQPYDSIAATVWRLSGQLPAVTGNPVNGGSPIPNDAYYFLTGQSLDLVDLMRERTERIMAEMRPDGSFLFATRFPDFEAGEPSAGYSARRTLEMMAYARLTGDRRAFEQVERSLEFMTQFRIPRGGRFWEAPLQTPDLLTAAQMVVLHVWAYEFSRNEKYLEQAQHWALMGMPFVYLRDECPHMLYATVPMFGASERENPVWFGTSQPWCGCVYACGVTLLGQYDTSIDWLKIARGILHSAEALQFESGPYIGCIPDGFSLVTQESVSWKVNPTPLAALRWLLDTGHEGCAVIHDRNIRVVSPFPAKLTRDGVVVEGAPEGVSYQLLINGSQVIDVQGNKNGRNFVPIK